MEVEYGLESDGNATYEVDIEEDDTGGGDGGN